MRFYKQQALLIMLFTACLTVIFILMPSLPSAQHCHRDDGSDCSQQTDNQYNNLPDKVTDTEADVKQLLEAAHGTRQDTPHISVVACGDRLPETVIMIKSALLVTKAPITAHIFAETDLQAKFKQELDSWPKNATKHLTYYIYDIQFPKGQKADEWKQLFKLCASQRIFIPDILKDVDATLYVDTDILFLRPVSDIWKFFSHFNESQIAAMTQEHEEPSASWYARFARHPYVPPYGVNSGVMLMNLTRMRQVNFIKHIIPYYVKHKYDITWGDQDLINIYFHYFPEKLYQFQCHWNYRPDHCMYMSTCHSAEQNGVYILHGNRGVYHNDKQPAFKAVYESIRKFGFDDPRIKLLNTITQELKKAADTRCGRLSNVFLKEMRRQVEQSDYKKL